MTITAEMKTIQAVRANHGPHLSASAPLIPSLVLMAGLTSRLRTLLVGGRGEDKKPQPDPYSQTFPHLPEQKHTAPRIVSAAPAPPPPPELERPPEPRVAAEAPEDDQEGREREDLVREVMHSTAMMIAALEESGLDMTMAKRHLSLAESLLHQGDPERALRYATKAMELAEGIEAEQDRCPRCRSETKPRWILCPKCGAALRESRPALPR